MVFVREQPITGGEMVAAGAVGGAIIGAIFGGPAGAAIGALIGSALGGTQAEEERKKRELRVL